jgi:lipoprotein-anchoring transpeptidase ErfK/SrfK
MKWRPVAAPSFATLNPADGSTGMKSAVATVACLLLVAASGQAARATGGPRIAPHQEIVALLVTHSVRDRPMLDGKLVAFVGAERPITGERTVLPVLAQRIDNRGRSWLRVLLPGRVLGGKPPPRDGWISASSTLRSTTAWHIVVDVSTRRVVVYRDARRLRSYRAIVGERSTPTPLGEYFVEENVQLPTGQPGAPFALATSARSNVLQEFDGGPGQVALHGLDNIGGQLGTAVSHGCIRLADSAVAWLAARITPGVPLTII